MTHEAASLYEKFYQPFLLRKPDDKLSNRSKHMKLPCKPASANLESPHIKPMNKPTTVPAVLRRSAQRIIFLPILAIAVLVGLAVSASAQTVGFTTDTNAEQYGTYQNAAGGLLNIGRQMTVTGAGIEVFQLGIFDYQSDGLAVAHTVTLFDSTATPIASVTVPAGTAAPLINAFRFASLGTPLFLPAGNYSILAYQMDSSDPYGNGNAPGFNGGGNVSAGSGVYRLHLPTQAPDYPNGSDVNQGWSTSGPESFCLRIIHLYECHLAQ